MVGKSVSARVRNKKGDELTINHNETDSPILPIQQLEKLHNFRPDRVDWVFDQTQAEAEHRRYCTTKFGNFVFIERILGQVLAFFIGVAGILAGAYVALHGQPLAGGGIATVTIGTLAVAFITGRKKNKKAQDMSK